MTAPAEDWVDQTVARFAGLSVDEARHVCRQLYAQFNISIAEAPPEVREFLGGTEGAPVARERDGDADVVAGNRVGIDARTDAEG